MAASKITSLIPTGRSRTLQWAPEHMERGAAHEAVTAYLENGIVTGQIGDREDTVNALKEVG